jgi:hypothetical protein
MITPEQWKEIEKQANKLYTNLELEIIQEIAERIANVGYANTVVLNDILIAEEMGLMYQDIIRLVAKYNETSVSQIKDIFETAGVKSLEYDDKIYKLAGLNPSSLKQSTSMWQLLGATALKTHNNLSNLVMTTANTSQTQFYDAMNKAYMEVSTGVKSYSQSIIDTIKDISNQGTYITYPSGRNMSIESAVRMNIVTSVNQTCGKLQEMRAEEMGWDLMELTAHAGARPEHAEWQGKIVSRSGQKGYLSLNDIGYGEVTGFKGVNCRHDWSPYLKGLSLTYTNKELEKMKDAKVTYNGKQISQYDAEQMQRKMERRIRQDKKDIAGLQGILTSGNKDDKLLEDTRIQLANAQTKLKQDNSILNNFTKQTGLRKDNNRLVIANLKKTLNDDEKYAINTYISSESYKINEALRGKTKLTKQQEKIMDNLDRALNKCDNYKGNVVRVLEIKDKQKLDAFLNHNKVGEITEYNEYLSFSDKSNYNENANIFIYTNSKQGKDIRQFNLEESEILYKRNSKFIVENVVKKDNKYYILWSDINE